MKKRMGAARAVDIISLETLEDMPTGALLARLKRLRWCEEKAADSDMSEDEIESVGARILFKDSANWREAYDQLKAVLASREHVSR